MTNGKPRSQSLAMLTSVLLGTAGLALVSANLSHAQQPLTKEEEARQKQQRQQPPPQRQPQQQPPPQRNPDAGRPPQGQPPGSRPQAQPERRPPPPQGGGAGPGQRPPDSSGGAPPQDRRRQALPPPNATQPPQPRQPAQQVQPPRQVNPQPAQAPSILKPAPQTQQQRPAQPQVQPRLNQPASSGGDAAPRPAQVVVPPVQQPPAQNRPSQPASSGGDAAPRPAQVVVPPVQQPPRVLGNPAPQGVRPGLPPAPPQTSSGGGPIGDAAGTRTLRPGAPVPGRVVAPIVGPAKLDQVRQARVERTDTSGRRVIEEPGNRTIIRQNNTVIIHRNETARIQTLYPNANSQRLPGGLTQTTYVRPDGVRIFSEVDGAGRVVRRYGRGPGGRDVVYIDNRRFYRNLTIGVGLAAVGVGLAIALAPPVYALPRPKYIVEYERASDDDLYEALSAPPMMRLERAYSLDEVRYSYPLRERMRRIDLDNINFEFGSFEISEDQYGKLERAARAIARAIEKNPGEVFLIEGHTDAVGAADDNVSLSDRRAEAVARVLTEYYSIPMENLVTQGYGEQHLKIDTQDAERANRRVAIRRISPLLGQSGGDQQ